MKKGAIDMTEMTNEEIVKRLIDSKAINFDAIGKVITEIGPILATSKTDLRVVLLGRPNVLACLMPATDAMSLVGDLRNAGIGAAVTKAQGG
jgi:hypothetical protein